MAEQQATPEERLQTLLVAGQEANRYKWAMQAKARGQKVVGTVDSYIPEEIIYAAGLMPVQLIGTWRQNVPLSLTYRPSNTCRYCSHVFESLLSGELEFLDGIISSDWDDDRRRLFDQWNHVNKTEFRHILHVPIEDSELTHRYFADKLQEMRQAVGQYAGVTITDDAVWQAIGVYNKMRALLTQVYELRKQAEPPLTGAEVLGITTAALVMPKDEYVAELEAIVPYLRARKAQAKTLQPRLLVASDRLDNPAYLELVEDCGCLVAMDDLDTGSRYFWQEVGTAGEPMQALADRYLNRPQCPRMLFWDKQVRRIVEWAKEWKLDGVLNFPQRFSYPRYFGVPYFRKQMEKAGIPFISVEREYVYGGNVGQLRTRIEAFIENL